MEMMRPLKERVSGENDGLEAVEKDGGWSKMIFKSKENKPQRLE
jgi:hypothetical protein